jgi:hypothetical protein
VNVQDAKTHLSALLLWAQRRLGFLKGTLDVSFFAPLPESELQARES